MEGAGRETELTMRPSSSLGELPFVCDSDGASLSSSGVVGCDDEDWVAEAGTGSEFLELVACGIAAYAARCGVQ